MDTGMHAALKPDEPTTQPSEPEAQAKYSVSSAASRMDDEIETFRLV